MRVKANLGGAPVQVVCAPVDGRMPWKLDTVTLKDALFVLMPEGRARFLQGHNNMHAWIDGEPVDFQKPDNDWVRVRYNPHKHETFVDLSDRPVYRADYVTVRVYNGKAKMYAKGVGYEDTMRCEG